MRIHVWLKRKQGNPRNRGPPKGRACIGGFLEKFLKTSWNIIGEKLWKNLDRFGKQLNQRARSLGRPKTDWPFKLAKKLCFAFGPRANRFSVTPDECAKFRFWATCESFFVYTPDEFAKFRFWATSESFFIYTPDEFTKFRFWATSESFFIYTPDASGV